MATHSGSVFIPGVISKAISHPIFHWGENLHESSHGSSPNLFCNPNGQSIFNIHMTYLNHGQYISAVKTTKFQTRSRY